MSPEGCNVRNSYRLKLKKPTFVLMRIHQGFITKAKYEPSGKFLRLPKRLTPLTAEKFYALSDWIRHVVWKKQIFQSFLCLLTPKVISVLSASG